ncbi:E3 ubiquitin-protein ligase RNF180 [Austrofundulus limnaeus]|uniref:E3 ubiquitin-protein ligase RNF180-like n=1 Tax=Austrofundulus limnaeus TaxID=52670 RepID=A0A2I4CUY6_AUSLI|nr:PREDICTED: E3 ubiquitin-protein ligase RNF180-like [Austrofundulus limnaeus]XP_013883803.1 PREDICTED: E3 ubiquitin-protein ligase RNF180-like [Austrofundulus limnaeus]
MERNLLLLRCRRCRRAVLQLTPSATAADESSADVCTVWHLGVDQLPAWILTSVQQSQWTSGKLSCCSCGARLGGFNFLNGCKCPCGQDAPVHLNKSRLDRDQRHRVPIVRPRRTRSETAPGQSEPSGFSCPAGSSDGPPDGWDLQRRCSLDPDGSSADPRDRLRSRSGSKRQTFDSEAPTDPGVPGVHTLSQDQDQDQDQEDMESASDPEEVLGSSVRRRFSCDGDTLLQQEQDSSQPVSSSAAVRLKKREKNRLKSQKRKERRRQRWLQVLEDQAENGSPLDSEGAGHRDGLTCPVCLDVFFSPYACRPCGHVFCEPCLRTLGQNRVTDTPCPLCRALIANTSFHKELDQTVKSLFPRLYSSRKQSFQSASCSRWPLPNAKKPFGWFQEHRRGGARWRRWHLVHGGFTPGAVYLNDQGSLTGLVLIHPSSDYWILGLKILCVLLILLFSFCLGF